MNTELDLRSIVRPKKQGYEHGKPHKVFDNQLNQNFTADEINQKWCTDFTYLFLANHEVRYNCTIIDLYDRSVIASITSLSWTTASTERCGRLVHECCNYDGGNCIALGKELETALFHRLDVERGAVCGALFTPSRSNRAKYCPECAGRMKRIKTAQRIGRKRQSPC